MNYPPYQPYFPVVFLCVNIPLCLCQAGLQSKIMRIQGVLILLSLVTLHCSLADTIPLLLNATFTGPVTSLNISEPMIINTTVQPSFNYDVDQLDCSLPQIYTYFQSDQSLQNNTATTILITTNKPANITLTPRYNNIQPTLSTTTCLPPLCPITITNNCQPPIHYLNYFDILQLTISAQDYSATVSYYVYCKADYSSNTLEWGLIVEIVLVTVMIALVAMYSNPWSLGGRAIEINVWLLLLFIGLLGVGVIVGVFSSFGLIVCLNILCFTLGIVGVSICANEVIFLFRIKFLSRRLFNISSFQVRIMELISVSIGVGFTVGWYFSDNNIFLNNIVSICICVGLIKILKFTNLKIAGLAFLVTISLQLIIVIILYIRQHVSYNNLFLNSYNYPVQMQFPTLNPTYNQKCAWLPITSIVFPGMLLSYLRRFDSSRNTRVYLITATVLFLFGGIAWVFVNVPSNVTFPFGLISEPCMFGLVCVFAYQRREIRVIWSGQFYDQEFANQKELRIIMEMIDRPSIEERERQSTIDRNLIEQLRVNSDKESRMTEQNVVRSKFLRQ